MADYTLAEIRTMQEDAIRRVREMHERAKISLENSNGAHLSGDNQVNNQPPAPHKNKSTPTQKPANRQGYSRLGNMNAPPHKPHTEHKPVHNKVEKPEYRPIHHDPPPIKEDKSFFGSGLLKSFDFNSILKSFDIKNILNNPEQAFILMMLLLLLSEGADEILIFALIYIML